MSEETSKVPSFGITTETKSRNNTPFGGGFSKAVLTKVEKKEIGKDVKYNVLSFDFVDGDGIKTHSHTEFMVTDEDQEKANKKINALGARVKHIFEAFSKFPENGIGVGAKSWDEYFDMIVTAFNTGKEGKPIYTSMPVWVKMIYNNKNQIGLPYSPNFIEHISTINQSAPKTLIIDKRYDKVEQDSTANPTAPSGLGTLDPF